jgi:hypothetical protein
MTTANLPDPIELLDRLDPGALRRRLDELDGERRAVLTLLRAARARERRRPAPADGKIVDASR